ncbi:helicase HerA-like domain-containing protein [Acinetobacter baumannii]|nr:PF05872 family protein [Acinetobacter baumannii Naval-57]
MGTPIVIAKNINDTSKEIVLLSQFANRHGLIAGATGTGKTVTLKVLAESFSRIGVPVFLADAKGDVSSLAKAGEASDKFNERLKLLQIDSVPFAANPVVFWDLFGQQGHPIRTTISEIGPILLARILNLNDTQEGVLSAVFRIADDQGLLLVDFKDLKAMITFVSEHAAEFKAEYGNLSPASLGAIQRNLLALADQGGEQFFGEPALNILDFIQTDANGHGYINILAADKLMNTPKLYATFLLWMLSELFEQLPEVGDMDKPKLVFFFDEAHLLFDNASQALQEKIEQVVRLIRSKGVGIYFITQNPLDLPESVLGQLGNRVQHALRAFTPKDQKAVKTAADTFRSNPDFKVDEAITELGVGEALISCLDEQGTPQIVERGWVMPPYSSFTPITPEERQTLISQSIIAGVYEQAVDRDSAYEMLQNKVAEREQQKQDAELAKQQAKEQETLAKQQAKEQERLAREQQKEEERAARERAKLTQDIVGTFAKSAARSLGGSTGQKLVRGLLGSLFGKKNLFLNQYINLRDFISLKFFKVFIKKLLLQLF